MILSIIKIAALVFICFYAAVRLRYELQMMQQNSYRPERYLRWLRGDIAGTARVTDLLMLAVAAGFSGTRWGIYAIGAVGVLALYKGVKELRVNYKKPLVFTARALRLYGVGAALVIVAVAAVWWGYGPGRALTCAMAAAVLSPLVMCLALLLLMPVEKLVNRWYVNDARRILRSMPNLVVIGITGSYGKTSTKHYLHRILSERFSVVMTPGSFNTTLGVVRTIREHLKPYTQVFIVEMGAKQPGDIAEICDLVKPRIGIITAVGEQHLESFKTIENVGRTKFELVDALPPDGIAILNDDFEYIARRPVTNVAKVFRYTSQSLTVGGVAVSLENEAKSEYRAELCAAGMELAPNGSAIPPEATQADFRVTDVKYGRGETAFEIEGPEGKSEPFTTKLVGIHNLSNILAGYIAGRELGMTGAEMRYAIGGIEQVEHRLHVKQGAGGVTIIDDAFNSNPHGAAMALDVLTGFTEGRRIVVTPGMIELGAKQEYHNRELGRRMAAVCDIAVIVGEYNRDAILAGLTEGGLGARSIYTARDFADASRHLREIVRAGDTVLYENDLPDTFK